MRFLRAFSTSNADEGITTTEEPKVLRLRPFADIGTPTEIINGAFGGKAKYEQALRDLEEQIYRQASSE